MKDLDPKRLRKVAKRLRKSCPSSPPRILDFDREGIEEGQGQDEDPCGTVACLAGHWLHIRALDPDVAPVLKDHLGDADVARWEMPWKWGANLLVADLGLDKFPADLEWPDEDSPEEFAGFVDEARQVPDRKHLLSEYADKFPAIWGNDFGWDLWCNRSAWSEPGIAFDEENGLASVADHMLRVAERIEKEES